MVKTLSPSTISQLQEDLRLLHLLYHRNKNQHRLTKWWRSLNTLRRHLRFVVRDADAVATARSTPAKQEMERRLTQRATFITRVIAPAAWKGFGSVVADRQFAGLGCVLVGVLARTWKCLGGDQEMRARKARPSVSSGAIPSTMERVPAAEVSDTEGVVIDRDEYIRTLESQKQTTGGPISDGRDSKQDPQEMGKGRNTGLPDTVQKRKKRKRKEDLDELFSGLF